MRTCCERYERMRKHLAVLTPAAPTQEQADAVKELSEMIGREEDAHMEASFE